MSEPHGYKFLIEKPLEWLDDDMTSFRGVKASKLEEHRSSDWQPLKDFFAIFQEGDHIYWWRWYWGPLASRDGLCIFRNNLPYAAITLIIS